MIDLTIDISLLNNNLRCFLTFEYYIAIQAEDV